MVIEAYKSKMRLDAFNPMPRVAEEQLANVATESGVLNDGSVVNRFIAAVQDRPDYIQSRPEIFQRVDDAIFQKIFELSDKSEPGESLYQRQMRMAHDSIAVLTETICPEYQERFGNLGGLSPDDSPSRLIQMALSPGANPEVTRNIMNRFAIAFTSAEREKKYDGLQTLKEEVTHLFATELFQVAKQPYAIHALHDNRTNDVQWIYMLDQEEDLPNLRTVHAKTHMEYMGMVNGYHIQEDTRLKDELNTNNKLHRVAIHKLKKGGPDLIKTDYAPDLFGSRFVVAEASGSFDQPVNDVFDSIQDLFKKRWPEANLRYVADHQTNGTDDQKPFEWQRWQVYGIPGMPTDRYYELMLFGERDFRIYSDNVGELDPETNEASGPANLLYRNNRYLELLELYCPSTIFEGVDYTQLHKRVNQSGLQRKLAESRVPMSNLLDLIDHAPIEERVTEEDRQCSMIEMVTPNGDRYLPLYYSQKDQAYSMIGGERGAVAMPVRQTLFGEPSDVADFPQPRHPLESNNFFFVNAEGDNVYVRTQGSITEYRSPYNELPSVSSDDGYEMVWIKAPNWETLDSSRYRSNYASLLRQTEMYTVSALPVSSESRADVCDLAAFVKSRNGTPSVQIPLTEITATYIRQYIRAGRDNLLPYQNRQRERQEPEVQRNIVIQIPPVEVTELPVVSFVD